MNEHDFNVWWLFSPHISQWLWFFPFLFFFTDFNSFHDPHDIHDGYGAIGVAVIISNRSMQQRHKTEISFGQCINRFNELHRSQRCPLSEVSEVKWAKDVVRGMVPRRHASDKINKIWLIRFGRCSATISKVFSHWNIGGRKGRMSNGGQTLDPAITQSVLMNTYSAANHDMDSIGARNGKYQQKWKIK